MALVGRKSMGLPDSVTDCAFAIWWGGLPDRLDGPPACEGILAEPQGLEAGPTFLLEVRWLLAHRVAF